VPKTTPSATAPPYSVAAVDRALDLIEALRATGPASLSDLALVAGCTRSAAFRLLQTLRARGYAQQDQTRGTWRLGARWLGISRAARFQQALSGLAVPYLRDASDRSGEHIYLLARTYLHAEVIAVQGASLPIRHYAEHGQLLPLHAGPGRLLLAHAPEAVRDHVLAQKLPKLAAATRADPAWHAAELPRLRARGWMLAADELIDGVTTLAVPVQDAAHEVCAVLCIMSASFRLRPPRPRDLASLLQSVAEALGAALGA